MQNAAIPMTGPTGWTRYPRHREGMTPNPSSRGCALTTNVCRCGSGGVWSWSSPALVTFAADAGALAALGGQDGGVAGVGVAPAQVGLQVAGEHGVVGMVRVVHDEGPDRAELGFDRVGPGSVGRGQAQVHAVARCPAADLRGGVDRQVVADDVDGGVVGTGLGRLHEERLVLRAD